MTKKNIVVSGSASCGKTLYLRKLAEYYRKQGKKILIIKNSSVYDIEDI